MPDDALGQLDQITAAWHQAKEAFEESERRYRNLVEHSLGLICTHDLDGRILSINPAAARSLGYEPEHGLGANLADFLAPEARHLFAEYLQRIQSSGHDAGLMRVISRDGAARVWMYRNVLYREADRPVYVLGHAIDITERVAAERRLRENETFLREAHDELDRRVRERTLALEQANERLRIEIAERQRAEEQAREANRLKDEFLSTLSHELRTPLNVVYGWARILRMRELDTKTTHAIEVIERNSYAQLRLIEDVFDVARIITGKMTLERKPVSIQDVLAATIDEVRPALEAKGVRLDARLEAGLGRVNGDPQRLQQVFWNVLSNAVKFTRAGDLVTVMLRKSGEWVEALVADTGVGIRGDVLPFVFDRFRQADSSTTRNYGGLGLGLAIVRHIVDLHGGTVGAYSEGEGHGATVTIRLPVDRQPHAAPLASAPVVAEPTARPSSRPLAGGDVLIVEDHDDARELVASVLAAAGADVRTATSAGEALESVARAMPDLLVADLGLPGEDGYALLERIRAMGTPAARALPAVALTALARPSDQERAQSAGFLRYIIKPIDPTDLVNALVSVLEAKRA
jgi:PAS domain S-box-containing protein